MFKKFGWISNRPDFPGTEVALCADADPDRRVFLFPSQKLFLSEDSRAAETFSSAHFSDTHRSKAASLLLPSLLSASAAHNPSPFTRKSPKFGTKAALMILWAAVPSWQMKDVFSTLHLLGFFLPFFLWVLSSEQHRPATEQLHLRKSFLFLCAYIMWWVCVGMHCTSAASGRSCPEHRCKTFSSSTSKTLLYINIF